MKIIDIQIMRGPSIWSIERSQLIIFTVDTEKSGSLSKAIKPALFSHTDTLVPGAGIQQDIPTLLSFLIKAFVQHTGASTDYTQATETGPGLYRLEISYEIEQVTIAAAKSAISFINTLMDGGLPDVEIIKQELQRIAKAYALGATSTYILNEAKKRHIPFHRFQNSSLFTLGYGKNQKLIRTAVTDTTSGLG